MMVDEPEPTGEVRVPVVVEELHVGKAEVVTDELRVTTSIETRDQLVEMDVERGILRIERVAVELPVEAAPPVRQEGDTTIVSVVEERVVVETRLFVVEEVHITREAQQEHVAIPVTLRSTRATVERPTHQTPTERIIDGRPE